MTFGRDIQIYCIGMGNRNICDGPDKLKGLSTPPYDLACHTHPADSALFCMKAVFHIKFLLPGVVFHCIMKLLQDPIPIRIMNLCSPCIERIFKFIPIRVACNFTEFITEHNATDLQFVSKVHGPHPGVIDPVDHGHIFSGMVQ